MDPPIKSHQVLLLNVVQPLPVLKFRPNSALVPIEPTSSLRIPGLGQAGLTHHPGPIPLSVSSLSAFSFSDRCASPMPRSTCGAFVNCTFSYAIIWMQLPSGSRKSRNGPGSGSMSAPPARGGQPSGRRPPGRNGGHHPRSAAGPEARETDRRDRLKAMVSVRRRSAKSNRRSQNTRASAMSPNHLVSTQPPLSS